MEQTISFEFTARYYKLGEITASTRAVWFVLHGYGQLAQYFIRKFARLEERNICVIAPEGLSRFYLESLEPGKGRKNNRVGATWMTRENRDADIRNYITYLNTIYQKEIGSSTVSVTILGFSQGSATASRWVMDNDIRFERLILWAGVFPPDMDFTAGNKILINKEVVFVYGKNDPFVNDDRFTEMKNILTQLNIQPVQVTFEGDHDIDTGTLLRLS